jgi:carbonic anhydrase
VGEVFDELRSANRDYVASGVHREEPVRPSRQLAVVTCMDARIPVFGVLGLDLGDAHVLRTAGARVTEDVLRSLTLSTHVLGTRAVALIGHTDCGLLDPDGRIEQTLTDLMGHPPIGRDWGTFTRPEDAIERDTRTLLTWSDRPEGFAVAGYLLDVRDGSLDEVVAPTVADPA